MKQTQEREIGGKSWQVTQFPASEGLKILTRLIKLLGGPLSKAISALEGEGSILDAKLDFKMLGDSLADLASRMDEDEILTTIKRLLADTRCEGREVRPQFETLFMGDYLTMLQVVMFVVEVNYQLPLTDLQSFIPQGLRGSQVAVEHSKQQTPASS